MQEVSASKNDKPSKTTANMAGAFAILCWALLAFLTVGTDGIPPFQTAAVAFAVGATVGVILALAPRGRRSKPRRTPWAAIFFSSLGLFGYHALYFSALKSAPAAEASLIAYLWPVLIVIGSALVPGERLRWFHILGACAGFAGCALLIGSSGGLGFSSQFIFGYTLAFAAAFTWSGYSLGSRMFADVPTRFVTISCAVAAILSSAISLTFERWVHEPTLMQWCSLIALGVLPLGGAFYTWDYGVKFGDIQWIGTASYGAPLLSTIVLVLAGTAAATWSLAAACLLIVGGAVIASGVLTSRRKLQPDD